MNVSCKTIKVCETISQIKKDIEIHSSKARRLVGGSLRNLSISEFLHLFISTRGLVGLFAHPGATFLSR